MTSLLSSDWNLVTLRGNLVLTDGTTFVGQTIQATLSCAAYLSADGQEAAPNAIPLVIQPDGTFKADVPATDDPAVTYEVSNPYYTLTFPRTIGFAPIRVLAPMAKGVVTDDDPDAGVDVFANPSVVVGPQVAQVVTQTQMDDYVAAALDALVDDTTTADDTVWSSDKTNDEIGSQIAAQATADRGIYAPIAEPVGAAAQTTADAAAVKANNLSDLASASAARTNLGLGTAATHAAGDFAAPSDVTAGDAATLAAAEAYTDQRLGSTGFAYTGFAWYEAGATNPDTYAALDATGQDAGALSGNTGYGRITTGVAANPAVQTRMRRCLVANDGSAVTAYLDADDSTKLAGADGTTGWVRVYEGPLDPVATTPGQTASPNPALWDGIQAWDAGVSYKAGARVSDGGSLWDSLNDNNLGVEPAAGTTDADLTGTSGQVMVEIPAFYYRMDDDLSEHRHNYEVVFDSSTWRPFPDLSTASDQPASVTVNGRTFALHPCFTKAGVQRRARYFSAFGVSATDTGNNGNGTLQSIADGTTTNTTSVSNTNFRAKAQNRNTGLTDLSGQANDLWSLPAYWDWHAIQLLHYTEFRTFYTQAPVGGGNAGGSTYNKVAGRTAPMGNSTGVCDSTGTPSTPGASTWTDAMSWRGIEDLWGTAWKWLDGWNIQNATAGKTHYACRTPSAFAWSTTIGYTLVATSVTGTDAWQYPTALLAGAFLPSAVGASQSTYETDGYYANALTDGSWRVAFVGGAAGAGGYAGAACLALSNGPGSSYVSSGSGLTL